MTKVTRSESESSGSSTQAQPRSERRSPSAVASQSLAGDRARPPRVTPHTAHALQRAYGNRTVATLARQPAKRMLQRAGSGKIIAGTFAASVGGKETVIQVLPWTDRDGRNNNFLYID